MKKTTLALVGIIIFLTANLYAHSGRTDSYGGHTNSRTGDYHTH